MKRLTERDEFGNADITGVYLDDLQGNLEPKEFNLLTEALNKLAEYEDKEEQGLLVELPCKVGDTLHIIKDSKIITGILDYFAVCDKIRLRVIIQEIDPDLVIGIGMDELGKTVFLVKEEAEKALAELQKEGK